MILTRLDFTISMDNWFKDFEFRNYPGMFRIQCFETLLVVKNRKKVTSSSLNLTIILTCLEFDAERELRDFDGQRRNTGKSLRFLILKLAVLFREKRKLPRI